MVKNKSNCKKKNFWRNFFKILAGVRKGKTQN